MGCLPIHLCLLQGLTSVFYSFQSFINIYQSLVSLIKCFRKYFIIVGAIVNGVFLISFSYSSLLNVCKNATNFCMLILYLVTSLNLLVLTAFWWSLQDFPHARSCHPQTEMILLPNFSIFSGTPIICILF